MLELNKLHNGDNLELLKQLPDNSIDSIVTDPPYGLSFMGKKWDYDVPTVELWKECLRVLKPGGHLLAFAGTRTQHRMAVRIEDAGFEIRDMIAWVYGSGFPKSLNIGKSIENKILNGNASKNGFHKLEGERRDGRIGMYDTVEEQGFRKVNPDQLGAFELKPTTDEGKEREGRGTALKPAIEPITLARKPIEGTVAENCLKWGTGGINIDESRVEASKDDPNHREIANKTTLGTTFGSNEEIKSVSTGKSQLGELGRFPANLIHDNSEEVRECFPETKSGKATVGTGKGFAENASSIASTGIITSCFADSGNASRFFKSIIYQAKASKSERNMGCEGLEEKQKAGAEFRPNHQEKALNGETGNPFGRWNKVVNNHPTVKPIALMEYLIKMVTKKGGIVLDPFMGSGTTGIAAKKNGYQFIGMELDEGYYKIAEARINSVDEDNNEISLFDN